MSKEDIKIILTFLQRATLNGQEVETFVRVVNLLSDMLNEVNEDDGL